jgi:hypothetical protein
MISEKQFLQLKKCFVYGGMSFATFTKADTSISGHPGAPWDSISMDITQSDNDKTYDLSLRWKGKPEQDYN